MRAVFAHWRLSNAGPSTLDQQIIDYITIAGDVQGIGGTRGAPENTGTFARFIQANQSRRAVPQPEHRFDVEIREMGAIQSFKAQGLNGTPRFSGLRVYNYFPKNNNNLKTNEMVGL